MGQSMENLRDLIKLLNENANERIKFLQNELTEVQKRLLDMAKLEPQQEMLIKNVERIEREIRDFKIDHNLTITRIHERLDIAGRLLTEEIGKQSQAMTNATNRVEENLGKELRELGEALGVLSNDYGQKNASIKAVWYVGGLLVIMLQGVGSFLVKSYIDNLKSRLDANDHSIIEIQKKDRDLEETIKELQNTILNEKK